MWDGEDREQPKSGRGAHILLLIVALWVAGCGGGGGESSNGTTSTTSATGTLLLSLDPSLPATGAVRVLRQEAAASLDNQVASFRIQVANPTTRVDFFPPMVAPAAAGSQVKEVTVTNVPVGTVLVLVEGLNSAGAVVGHAQMTAAVAAGSSATSVTISLSPGPLPNPTPPPSPSPSPSPPSGPWTLMNTGLEGGGILSLAFDVKSPTTLYADADRGGFFRSLDGGASWQRMSTTRPTSASELAVDPQVSGTVYAAGLGVAVSKDGGATWTAINNGLPSGTNFVNAIAVDPLSPSTLYCAIYGGAGGAQLFKSTNAGASWSLMSNGITSTQVSCIAVDPHTSGAVYAGTTDAGIFKSADGGATWTVLAGSPNTSGIVIDPVTPVNVYAEGGSGVSLSTDAGGTWSSASMGLPAGPTLGLAIVPSAPGTLFVAVQNGGVFKTTNSGATWAPVGSGIDVPAATATIASSPVNSSIVGIATGAGVYLTQDGGATWSFSNRGLNALQVDSIVVDPTRTNTIYLGAGIGSLHAYDLTGTANLIGGGTGVYKSVNSAQTWTRSSAGITDNGVMALAVDPVNPATIFAVLGSGGVGKTVDGGQSWAHTEAGIQLDFPSPSFAPATCIAVDPINTQNLYAGSSGAGVYRSTDAGASWTPALTGFPTATPTSTSVFVGALVVDPATPSTIYAGTGGISGVAGVGGVYASSDGGSSWTSSSTGIGSQFISSLVLGSRDPTTLYAAAANVYHSANGASGWSSSTSTVTKGVVLVATSSHNPAMVYACGSPSGGAPVLFVRSADGGVTWTDISSKFPDNRFAPSALAVDPTDENVVYAGTVAGELFKSVTGGQ